MISRRTSRVIAEIYERFFREYHHSRNRSYYNLDTETLYDFLFDNNYPAWFCNLAKNTWEITGTRKFKEFLMCLHTGESVVSATKEWTWKQREQLGQQNLTNLAQDILNHWSDMQNEKEKNSFANDIETLKKNLELDGYSYKKRQLLASESDIFDMKEESGVLESTFTNLSLNNKETAFHHLKLSDEHYLASKWDDSISNSRKFLEAVLQEVAFTHSLLVNKTPLSDDIYSRPVRVREYLEKQGLLETKEKEALSSVYGLLSDTGSHPYIAQNEQARLLRHLALTFAQFVMLRLYGFKTKNGG